MMKIGDSVIYKQASEYHPEELRSQVGKTGIIVGFAPYTDYPFVLIGREKYLIDPKYLDTQLFDQLEAAEQLEADFVTTGNEAEDDARLMAIWAEIDRIQAEIDEMGRSPAGLAEWDKLRRGEDVIE